MEWELFKHDGQRRKLNEARKVIVQKVIATLGNRLLKDLIQVLSTLSKAFQRRIPQLCIPLQRVWTGEIKRKPNCPFSVILLVKKPH